MVPFQMSLQCTLYLVTLGATNLVNYIIAFFTEMMLGIITRLVFSPLSAKYSPMIPMYIYNFRLKLGQFPPRPKIRRPDGMQHVVSALTLYSGQALGMYLMFGLLFFLFIYKHEAGLGEEYDMRPNDLLYYLLFNAILPVGRWVLDIFCHSILETTQGWKIHDYLQDCDKRFKARRVRWKMDEIGTTGTRKLLQEPFRTLDQNCFSSQFFFSVSHHCSGMWLLTLGSTFVLNSKKSPLNDSMFPVIMTMTAFIFNVFFAKAGRKLAAKHLWNKYTPLKNKEAPINEVVRAIEKLEDMNTDDLRTVVAVAFNHAQQISSQDPSITIVDELDPNAPIDTDKIVSMGFKASGSAKVGQTLLPDWPDELGDGAKWVPDEGEEPVPVFLASHKRDKTPVSVEENPKTYQKQIRFKSVVYEVDWIGGESPVAKNLVIKHVEQAVGGAVVLSNDHRFRNPEVEGDGVNDFADFGVNPAKESDEIVPEFDFSDFNYDKVLEEDDEPVDVGFQLDVGSDESEEEEHGDWPEELDF